MHTCATTPAARALEQAAVQILFGCRRGRWARWRKKHTTRSASSREKGREARRALGFPLLHRHDLNLRHVFTTVRTGDDDDYPNRFVIAAASFNTVPTIASRGLLVAEQDYLKPFSSTNHAPMVAEASHFTAEVSPFSNHRSYQALPCVKQ